MSRSPTFLMRPAVADMIEAFKCGNDLLVMGDDDDRGLIAGRHIIQNLDHRQGPLPIERRGWFIGEDHGRTADQRPGNGDALLLSTRELRGHGLGAMSDIKRRQQLHGTGAGPSIGLAGEHRQEGDIVGHVEKRDQIGRLKNESDPVATQRPQIGNFPFIVVDDLLADRHPSGRRFDHCAKAFEQGTLARSRRTDEADNLARSDVHIHAPQRMDRRVAFAIGLDEVFDEDAVSHR